MRLVLELLSPESESVASAARFVVGYEPALIGRGDECDWVFNDRYISRQHAQIRFFNGLFFVEAIGQNLIAIDDPNQQVPRGKSQPLRDGCRLFVDMHEIRVSLQEDDTLAPGPQRSPQPAGREQAPIAPRAKGHDDLAGIDFSSMPGPGPGADDFDVVGLMEQTGARPPALPPQPEQYGRGENPKVEIPDDDEWWKKPTGGDPKDSVGAEPIPEPSALPAGHAGELAELLRGAGIDPAGMELGPEVARQLGEILRITVEGTMDVLKSRAEIKEQFRMPGTRVQRKDNNPLKFSADVGDALHNLLVKRSDAYLPPVEAFENAFEEIRRHQLAMLHGLRVAFDQLMRKLDPKKLADGVGQQGKSGILIGNPRARYWDAYENMMKELARAPEDRFRQLFGDAFGRAYEEQLARLAPKRRSGTGQQQ